MLSNLNSKIEEYTALTRPPEKNRLTIIVRVEKENEFNPKKELLRNNV
jgi:hypothetical protein